MGLGGFLKGLAETVVNVAVTPVEVVKDAITLGGTLTDERETYTGKRLRKVAEKAEETWDELDD